MSDDRTTKVTIYDVDFYVTPREAAGLLAMLKAMRSYDLESGRTIDVTLHDVGGRSPISGEFFGTVSAIKAIRTLTGWDLKTSKEAWDRRPIKIRIDSGKVSEVESLLQSHGITYSGISIIERIAKMDQTGGVP